MIKIFKYLKSSVISIILIVCLLATQAICDLSLPDYTSKIVNVGIQQNGIENAASLVLTEKTYNNIKLLLSDEEQEIINKNYEYLTKEDWEDFETYALGNYVGIGIYMSTDKNDNVVVVEPIKDSPAEKVGLKPGDIIVGVNDESVIGVSSENVSNMIKGEEGTKVKITVARGDEYLDFEIERKSIKIYHVESEMFENNIGYLELLTFDEGCAKELKQKYTELKNQGAQKIILDLRNNTGGLVTEALDILDLFLPKGETVLITVDAKDNQELSKTNDAQYIKEDVVVLVNEYSASASEIVAGALKDTKRAQIVGKTTYGKGVIQSVFMLEDGSALKLTVEEYYTPSKTKIHKVGIKPDYEVELDLESKEDAQLNKAKELLK